VELLESPTFVKAKKHSKHSLSDDHDASHSARRISLVVVERVEVTSTEFFVGSTNVLEDGAKKDERLIRRCLWGAQEPWYQPDPLCMLLEHIRKGYKK
jgi:hypothetical protein